MRLEGKREKKKHVLWTKNEKEAVMTHLGSFLAKKYLPGKDACLRCIRKSSPILDKREWSSIKYLIMNAKRRAQKQLEKD